MEETLTTVGADMRAESRVSTLVFTEVASIEEATWTVGTGVWQWATMVCPTMESQTSTGFEVVSTAVFAAKRLVAARVRFTHPSLGSTVLAVTRVRFTHPSLESTLCLTVGETVTSEIT